MRKTMIALVSAVVLLLGACGDDGDDSAADDTTTTTAGDGDDSNAEDGGTDEGNGGASGDFCEQIEALPTELTNIDNENLARFDEAIDEMQNIEPPEAIAEDWTTFVDGMATLSGIGELGLSDEEASQEFTDRLFGLDQQAMTDASQNISEYISSECDVDL